MKPTSDRTFLLCELAAILSVLASAPAVGDEPAPEASVPASGDQRQPITYEQVYGRERLTLGGFSPFRITWLDDEHYLRRESAGWLRYSARSGAAEPWYDSAAIKSALLRVPGVSDADAGKLATGGWIEFLPTRRLVVFRVKDRLIRMNLEGMDASIVEGVPEQLELSTLSPTGSGLAFIQNDELWVVDFDRRLLKQLTFDASRFIRNGKADWVYFEEVYNRSWMAYRWSPDGRSIAYQQFDDTHVPTFTISDHTSVAQSFETEHFPKAGETNPLVRLGIVQLDGGPTRWIDHSDYRPDDFLLVHFNWLPDSQSVYWFAQNRIQTWLDVISTSVSSGSNRKLMREETEAWVENPMDLTFLSDGSFLYFSERTGWRHLYHATADGSEVRQITTGEWEVRELHAISADEKSALVSGTRDSHLAENLYRVSLSADVPLVTRLTAESGHHAVSVSRQGSYVADSQSSAMLPTRVVMRSGSDGVVLRELVARTELPTGTYRFAQLEFIELPMADGSTTTGLLIRPPDFDPSRKYPVWLKTYGGPHAPTVKDQWNSRLADHLLANLGIVVLHWDPRTASGRGAQSAWLAYKKLGVEETRDLNAVCDWLSQQTWVDAQRIGQSGHSYGGYFTSYAMTHTDRLCAGIAGAPVTDWANYDTIYTERFMSTPQLNPDGYRTASVIAAADRLHGRLLVLHGLIDDNVHPENTIQLTHALQGAGKPFELMLYPKARHAISGDHYNLTVFNFIVTAMGKPEAARWSAVSP